MKPKKHLGQNFLQSKIVLEQFINACSLSEKDVVIEVGGGTGVVTRAVTPLVKELTTYEFDSEVFDKYLKPLEQTYPNLIVVNEDILGANVKSNMRTSCSIQGTELSNPICKILGSLPYQITSPLLHKLVVDFYGEEKKPSFVFILQKEVAEKVAAQPPRGSYLSNFVALYGKAQIVGSIIPPAAFYPAPKVNSAILKVVPYGNPGSYRSSPSLRSGLTRVENPLDIIAFSKFLHHGFKNPRKMLNKAFAEEQLTKAGINPNLRAQNLSLDDWLQLFATISRKEDY